MLMSPHPHLPSSRSIGDSPREALQVARNKSKEMKRNPGPHTSYGTAVTLNMHSHSNTHNEDHVTVHSQVLLAMYKLPVIMSP